jgi:hypothetical protein
VAIKKPSHAVDGGTVHELAAHAAWRFPPVQDASTGGALESGARSQKVAAGASKAHGPARALLRNSQEGIDGGHKEVGWRGGARQQRRGGWAKGASPRAESAAAPQGGDLGSAALADMTKSGVDVRVDAAAVGVAGSGAAVAFCVQIQGNLGAGVQELARRLATLLLEKPRWGSQNLLVAGGWAEESVLPSIGWGLVERSQRSETGACTPIGGRDDFILYLDAPPDVCLARARGVDAVADDAEASRDLAATLTTLKSIDDDMFRKVLDAVLEVQSGRSSQQRLLVLDWREIGHPGDVWNMVRGATNGAFELPRVLRAAPGFRAPDDAYVVTLELLLEMGRGLAQGQDVFSSDFRATPGSFLQVTASLLEGAYAMGLEADLTIADEAHGALAPVIHVCEPASGGPPPQGISSADWQLIQEAFKRLVLHLLSRLRSVVLINPP